MNKQVTDYIKSSNEDHREILTQLREILLSIAPNVNEQFKWSRPVYGLEKDFCYLQATKKHVTLGFFEFAKVKTNQQLIEGTGKSMRHVKLTDLKHVEEFKVKKMIAEVLK